MGVHAAFRETMAMDTIAHVLWTPFICVGWLIVGALAGMIANSIMRTNQPLVTDLILGLVGSVVGGAIISVLGISKPDSGVGGVLASLIVAVLGAVVVIMVFRAVNRRLA
jgi:uncharacterized membrane protein YeaQ/YmgE (transglycosylase-associated protein family)